MTPRHPSTSRRGAAAVAALLAAGALAMAGCGSTSGTSASTAAGPKDALGAEFVQAYTSGETSVTTAEDAVVNATDANMVLAAWPTLEGELRAYDEMLGTLQSVATGTCKKAVQGYIAIERREATLLRAIYDQANSGDPDSLKAAKAAYATLVAGDAAKKADAAFGAACGVKVS